MNILVAADYATPASGNFIASFVELGRMIKEAGDTLTFIFPENKNTLSEISWVHWLEREGHAVYLSKSEKSDAEKLAMLKKIITVHKIDILHLHFSMFHNIVINNAKNLGVKILIHDHMDFTELIDRSKQIIRCALKSMLYRKNGITVASVNPDKNKAYIFAKNKYVPNGISFIRNVDRIASREECREEIGLEDDELMCMFLGWDVHRKGIDIAVKAIEKMRNEGINISLGVIGIGNPPNPERMKYIEKSTGISADAPWIKYLPSREDMYAYHRASDVYLSSSRSEAFAYGIIEAISQNVPVAVSNIKGTKWCHTYSKAVVYETEDSKDCARAIKKALKLGRTESNNMDMVNSYSINEWCNRMIQLYNSL